MAKKNIAILLSLLTLTSNVHGQFYDILQGYQTLLPTFTPTKISDHIVHPQEMSFTTNFHILNRDRTLTSLSHQLEANIESLRKKLATNELHNRNFITTPTPTRKTTRKTNHNNYQAHDSQETSKESSDNRGSTNKIKKSDPENKRRFADNKISHTTTEPNSATRSSSISTKSFGSTPRPYVTSVPNSVATRPYATTKSYYNGDTVLKPNNFDYYSTPSTIRPGVKAADVDINQPPITNKPASENDFPILYDSPNKKGDHDRNPEIVMGPDEDEMSSVEKRRYEEMVEKMCDKFKSFNVKKLEAIPLVPSPEPLQINVSVCNPTKIPLVVGGRIATIQEFPHMALLGWTYLQGGGYAWKCGGSLINERYVLTAGHCTLQDTDDSVVTGAPRVVQIGSSYMDDAKAIVIKVGTVIQHPKYVRTRSYYDVALLKLVEDVVFSDVVKPACLGDPPGPEEPVIATGWGKTGFAGSQSVELRSVSIPVWDLEECRQVLGTSRKMPVGPSADSQICAGERQGGKDTCQGDSGGPVQVQDGCTWRIVAITSLGRSCGAANTPAVYAKVQKAFIGAQLFGFTRDRDSKNQHNNTNKHYYNGENGKHNTHQTNENNYYQGVINSNEENGHNENLGTTVNNHDISYESNSYRRHHSGITKIDQGSANGNNFNRKPASRVNQDDRLKGENYSNNSQDYYKNNGNNQGNVNREATSNYGLMAHNFKPTINNKNKGISSVSDPSYSRNNQNNNINNHNLENNTHNLNYNKYNGTTSNVNYNIANENRNFNKHNENNNNRSNINNDYIKKYEGGANNGFTENTDNNGQYNRNNNYFNNRNIDNGNYGLTTDKHQDNDGNSHYNNYSGDPIHNNRAKGQHNNNQFNNGRDSGYNNNNMPTNYRVTDQ